MNALQITTVEGVRRPMRRGVIAPRRFEATTELQF
jgi:hypothetical protein